MFSVLLFSEAGAERSDVALRLVIYKRAKSSAKAESEAQEERRQASWKAFWSSSIALVLPPGESV